MVQAVVVADGGWWRLVEALVRCRGGGGGSSGRRVGGKKRSGVRHKVRTCNNERVMNVMCYVITCKR